MIREWIIRLGFIVAVLGFFVWLAIHLATFTGLGWAQLDNPWKWFLFIAYFALVFVAMLAGLPTRPTWTFKRGTPRWVRMRQTFALRPVWANLLHLLILLLMLYSLWWLMGGFPHVSSSVASLRGSSAFWIGLSLSTALSLGEYGLGWWNRWVRERGGMPV